MNEELKIKEWKYNERNGNMKKNEIISQEKKKMKRKKKKMKTSVSDCF